jgi:hypothetical protein
VIQQASTL